MIFYAPGTHAPHRFGKCFLGDPTPGREGFWQLDFNKEF